MPPPPRARLHSKTGKLKNINKTYSSASTIPSSAAESHSGNASRRNIRVAENPVVQNETESSTNTPDASASASTVADSSESLQQFEMELCWCIQTMEKSLEAGNVTAKQGTVFSLR